MSPEARLALAERTLEALDRAADGLARLDLEARLEAKTSGHDPAVASWAFGWDAEARRCRAIAVGLRAVVASS